MDIEHYRTLLQNEERRLTGIIKRKKENVRSIGGDSVPDAGDASYEGEVREEQAREAENASDTLKEVRLAALPCVAPNKSGSAVELGESKTNDAAILHDPVEIVTGTVAWRPERAETAFTVHIPLPVRALSVLDVCSATTGFEGLSGTVVIGKTSCCQGGCDVICPHGIAVSHSEVLERLDHYLLPRFDDSQGGRKRWTIFLLNQWQTERVQPHGGGSRMVQ